jgi:recombination DNA repair RAD52 pathway protein
MPLNDEVRKRLNAPIPANAVTQRKQSGKMLDYVEGWWVVDRLNDIVGNGEWGAELVSHEHVTTVKREDGKHDVTYRAIVRLNGPFVSQTGVGFATNTSGSLGDAHENAGKSAETDAFKRAAMRLGRHLGLALYEKPDEETGERTHVEKPKASHPEKLGDCVTPDELRSWLGFYGPKLRAGDQTRIKAAVRDAAAKCGVLDEQAARWLSGEF